MVQMKPIGQLLRETRESKNISIKQISNAIKIRESLIEALEKGEYSSFTSDMHLKSFLRSYASYLGLNEDRVMAIYRRDRQIKVKEDSDSNSHNTNKSTISIIISKYFNLKLLFSLFALIIPVLAIVFFYSQWKSFNSPPTLEIKSPKQNDVFTTENFVIEGFTGDPSIKVILDGNEANYIDSLGNFRINARFTEPGLKRFQLVAKNQFNKQTEVQLDVSYQPPVKLPQKPKIRIANKSSKIYTINLTKDKETTGQDIRIAVGSTFEVEFDEKVLIKNFDKNSLDIFLNNDQSPTTAIDFKDFSLTVQNNVPIIKEVKNEPKK